MGWLQTNSVRPMKMHFPDATQTCGKSIIVGINQSDVGSGTSGLNRSRARSNECHGSLDVSETFTLERNGVVDSS